MVPILNAEKHWVCPNCVATHVTHEQRPHTPFHRCKGLRGITAPYIPEGTRASVQTREREDYINGETVTTNIDGRPIMSVVTFRDDGQDCAVMAPCATVTGEGT